MPGRYYGRKKSFMPRSVINSIKNIHLATASTGTTAATVVWAKAVNTPLSTNSSDVSNGCIIKAVYLTIDVCGLAATGVLQITDFYLIKNPGANLSTPDPISVGTSNEKKFVCKQWRAMTMRNQDGNVPYHWEGWIKLPKRYWRMGTDDIWQIAFQTSTAAGHFSMSAIYKWYR